MPRLIDLVDQAKQAAETELSRQLQICNACRYCEGFCAVFPAMTRRIEFPAADVHYLANLCHGCGACLHACQYAPPHEFAVNVPRAMAQVRVKTYQTYAWPSAFAGLYDRHGLALSLALFLGLAIFFLLMLARTGAILHEPLQGNFYAIFPHGLMAGLFGAVGIFAALAMCVGLQRFWREAGNVQGADVAALAKRSEVKLPALSEAMSDALRLKYLGDCNNEDDAVTPWRRWMHHLTFYGFLLCFASTSVATVYHYLFAWKAPYPFWSLPVFLGTVGGISLSVGTAGLWLLHRRRHPLHLASEQKSLDLGLIALLFFVSTTGLLLLALRDTSLLGVSLAIHLGSVMAFFITLPYGKFAHGFYRLAALLKFNLEKRLPTSLKLGSD